MSRSLRQRAMALKAACWQRLLGADITPLFDAEFYVRRNGLQGRWRRHPFLHYLWLGRRRGLEHHPLFHDAFYRAGRPALDFSRQPPVVHFLREGGFAGCPPNPLFDPVAYLARYADVRQAGLNPLLHYLAHGEAEQRRPHVLFDPHWYQARVQAAGQAVSQPGLRHYFSAQGLTHAVHPLWDARHVAAQSPDGQVPTPVDYLTDAVLRDGMDPHPLWNRAWIRRRQGRPVGFLEYLQQRQWWLLNTHPLFDSAWYQAQLAEACQGLDRPALQHFIEQGAGLGCSPHPLFDSSHYLRHYPQGVNNPLLDYLENPADRSPHPLFDGGWIRRRQGRAIDLAEYLADPALRFISTHPLFDGPYYRQQALACGEAIEGPALLHYLERGWWQGYQPNRLFDSTAYLAAHPELARSGENPLLHYLADPAGRSAHLLWDAAWVERQSPGFTLADYLRDPQRCALNPHPLWDEGWLRVQTGRRITLPEYLRSPTLWTLSVHPLFDAVHYQRQLQQRGEELQEPALLHYLRGGWRHLSPHPLFDLQHYRHQAGDLAEPALVHFVREGWRQGLDPNPLFATDWYLAQNRDLDGRDINPLLHYVRYGEASGRSPHPLFDPDWYRQGLGNGFATAGLSRYFTAAQPGADPHPLWQQAWVDAQPGHAGLRLEHYLGDARHWSLRPHPLFDPQWYASAVAARDGAPLNGCPLLHFARCGWDEAASPHRLFDAPWYAARFRRLAGTARNPLLHYLQSGCRGNRRLPHPLWDQDHVDAQTDGLRVCVQDYLADARHWGLSPHPLFDPAHYLAAAGLPAASLTRSPLEHFLAQEADAVADPHPWFDMRWYRSQAMDAGELPCNALWHYACHGDRAGRSPHPLFDPAWYRQQLDEAAVARIGRLSLSDFVRTADAQVSPHPLWDAAWVARQRGGEPLSLARYREAPDCWALDPHPLFDVAWYRRRRDEAGPAPTGMSPLEDFLRHGWQACDPHPLFDGDGYLQRYPDVAASGRNPLLHFLTAGQGRSPHPLWDPRHVERQCERLGRPVQTVLDYLRQPDADLDPHPLWDGAWIRRRQGRAVAFLDYLRDPRLRFLATHPLFDAAYYRQQCHQSGEALAEPALLHYLRGGWRRSYHPNRLFDTDWYLTQHSDVMAIGLNPLLHYLSAGENRIRDPHPLFDAAWYGQRLQQEGQALPENLLAHFLGQPGEDEKSPHPLWDADYLRRQTGGETVTIARYLGQHTLWRLNPHPLFDAAHYQAQAGQTAIAPLLHYVKAGCGQFNPSVYFHTEWYTGRNRYLDSFAGKTRIPLVHFLLRGSRVGESPHPFFDSKWYADRYLGADRIGTVPVLHYLAEGWRQGCNPNPMFNAEAYRQRHGIADDEDALKWYLQRTPVRLPAQRSRFADTFVCQPVPARPASGVVPQPPRIRYLLLFTPRSGSSLLTDLLHSTGCLGQPGEWFNPDLVQRARNTLPGGAADPAEYTRKIQHYRTTANGVFGVELVWSHLQQVIEAGCEELLVTAEDCLLLHLRAGILAQAISLYLASESGYFHSHQAANRRYLPAYNAQGITTCLDRLLEQEAGICRYLGERRHPKRQLTFYEDLVADHAATVAAMAGFIGVDCRGVEVQSARQKIGTGINAEFEARYRDEQATVLAERLARRRQLFQGMAGVREAMFC